MQRPRVKKDKLSDGFYIDWYGIRVWFYGPSREPITEEYGNPFICVNESDEEKSPKYSFYVEGEEK
jgi:hypothetical protein